MLINLAKDAAHVMLQQHPTPGSHPHTTARQRHPNRRPIDDNHDDKSREIAGREIWVTTIYRLKHDQLLVYAPRC